MTTMKFKPSSGPTLGVEVEVALVESESMALASAIEKVLDRLPNGLSDRVKPELMQCYLEINTAICHTAAEAEADLRDKIQAVEQVTDGLGLSLLWSATHPFSIWQDQRPTPNERYKRLLELLQDMGRRLVTFGLHVHVGVESGDKAVMICDRIMRHLPMLLALSCNSPWWNGRITGLQSHRSKVMEGLPTAGLPSLMRNWSEYVWLVNHLVETGFIGSIRDIWWDVRPHHNFGTVEVRVCDIPGNLHDTMGLVALIHCLVEALSRDVEQGIYQHDCHPMLVRQNKWRAARYGLDTRLVDTVTLESKGCRDMMRQAVELLRPVSKELGSDEYLDRVLECVAGPTWAQRQLEKYRETNSAVEATRQFVRQARLSPE